MTRTTRTWGKGAEEKYIKVVSELRRISSTQNTNHDEAHREGQGWCADRDSCSPSRCASCIQNTHYARICGSLDLDPSTSLTKSATCVEVLFLLSNGMLAVIPYSQSISSPPVHNGNSISTGIADSLSHRLSFYESSVSGTVSKKCG